jgi:DNA-binding MarR family transcriptional regulator
LVAEGDRLTKPFGLTSARWKVLGALALAESPITVACIARRMGQTRQGVQRIADELHLQNIICYQDNPNHKRAKLLVLTEKGQDLYTTLNAIQEPWAEEKAKNIQQHDLKKTLSVLNKITAAFIN